MGYYEVKEIYPWLYSFKDPLDVFCYLIVGDERVLLFDSTHGVGSLPEAIGEVTQKPVVAVLGHGHIDHACGAYQFNEVFLHQNDFNLCREHTSPQFREDIIKGLTERNVPIPDGFKQDSFLKAGTGNLKALKGDEAFELGGLKVKVVEMPGHTTGSIGLLVLEKRILLTSDSASNHIWMFLKESTTISRYIKMLERIFEIDFTTFFTGHSNIPRPKQEFLNYIKIAKEASFEKAVPYDAFPEFNPYIYQVDDDAIVFNTETYDL